MYLDPKSELKVEARIHGRQPDRLTKANKYRVKYRRSGWKVPDNEPTQTTITDRGVV